MQESPLTGGERAFGGGALEYMMLVSMNLVSIYLVCWTVYLYTCPLTGTWQRCSS